MRVTYVLLALGFAVLALVVALLAGDATAGAISVNVMAIGYVGAIIASEPLDLLPGGARWNARGKLVMRGVWLASVVTTGGTVLWFAVARPVPTVILLLSIGAGLALLGGACRVTVSTRWVR